MKSDNTSKTTKTAKKPATKTKTLTKEERKFIEERNNEDLYVFQGQFVRESVMIMLEKVQEQIPDLILYEGWRSLEKQTRLFEKQKNINKELFPNMSEHQLDLYTHNQVAIPSKDPKNPAPHATGGAVDVGIKGLDFGCAFMEMCEATKTDCDSISQTAKDNRKLLREAMESVGFVNFPFEWWHYEYGIDTWVKVKGQTPFYDGIIYLRF